MNRKTTGSYYTPQKVADFVVKYLLRYKREKEFSIIEPSMGDGSFIRAVENQLSGSQKKAIVVGCDINGEAIQKAQESLSKKNLVLETHAKDFLSSYLDFDSADFVIGNPPYIRKKYLPKESILLCSEIHARANLSKYKINNIWTAFVIAATERVKTDGVLALVLPIDILQVKYSVEIRKYLENKFRKLEIFHLGKSVFEDADQETVLLIARKESLKKGTYFYKIEDFHSAKVTEISNNGLMLGDHKWTHYQLDRVEIALLNRIERKLGTVQNYVDCAAGIVTGANDFFVVDRKKVSAVNAKCYTKPILAGSRHVNSVEIGKDVISSLNISNERIHLIDLNKKSEKRKNKKLDDYLQSGLDLGYADRYKCSIRRTWYHVPNIGQPASAFIFKRCHLYPKLVLNKADVHVTDSAYKIEPKSNTCLTSFIRSFYTGITLIFAELMGRRYGGGVLEITPNEFRSLPICYTNISSEKYESFTKFIKFDELPMNLLFSKTVMEKLAITEDEKRLLIDLYLRLVKSRINSRFKIGCDEGNKKKL